MEREEPVEIAEIFRERSVDFSAYRPYTCKVVWTPLCWTGGFRSLTTDTMCQNLFETIQVFERGWSE